MKKITINDFSGGIQESYSPDDFTPRQSSVIKGFVPRNANTFQSQWPCQSLSNTPNDFDIPRFNGVFPLESSVGTFLVGITTRGDLLYTKVPPTTAAHDTFTPIWSSLVEAENYGYSSEGFQDKDIVPNNRSDYRFLTGLSLEVYKYVKEPFDGTRRVDFTQDIVPDTLNEGGTAGETFLSRSELPAVLIGCRRQQRGNTFAEYNDSYAYNGAVMDKLGSRMVVAFVDPRGSSPDYDGVGTTPGQVRVITFPNIRRWPTYTRNYNADDANGTPIETWPAEDGYGAEERAFPIKPVVQTKAKPEGDTTTGFLTYFPGDTNKYPRPTHWFHPYTYLDIASALKAGTGIIPKGNVACMWGDQLIIGDIEWRSDKAIDSSSSSKVSVPQNSALLSLNDGNTEHHRGSLYYSVRDIDEFDPRNVYAVSSGEARIAGMHMLDNRLICVTSYAGPNDGVIALSGNIAQLISYSGSDNPFAIRKQLIRGGVGVANRTEYDWGHRTQTCVWGDAGTVVFIDITGAIYYTDGVMLDRLDRYGPRQPAGSTIYDHVAAVGKHLIAYRENRLLCLTVLDSNGSTASGCWTELVRPKPFSGAGSIRSMIGSGNQLFMIVDGQVFRYVIDGPENEYGCIDGVAQDLTLASATLGDDNGHVKTNWHRVGLSFFTPTSATIRSYAVKAEAELVTGSPAPSPNASPVPSYSRLLQNSYTNGHYNVVVPAGIGPQTVMSVKFVMSGNIILQGLSLWVSGNYNERGEKV